MSGPTPNEARVIPLRPRPLRPRSGQPQPTRPEPLRPESARPEPVRPDAVRRPEAAREPLWRDLVGDVLRRERLAQERTLKDVADTARISVPYLSEVERGRKEASSEVLAAAAGALDLTLGDLLSLAHRELTRVTSATPVHRGRGPGGSPYGGLCLAA
ncbi:helix-turn-helix transcriptional regulator [Streptomyces sp. NPDC006997]|uniref:helix-turn-helix domain-containing protein n=1 Tax=Streptomyces sp. NPDC006997 TaxID=3155356 RepID=UPI00340B9A20